MLPFIHLSQYASSAALNKLSQVFYFLEFPHKSVARPATENAPYELLWCHKLDCGLIVL